jgi:hypothetical protein
MSAFNRPVIIKKPDGQILLDIPVTSFVSPQEPIEFEKSVHWSDLRTKYSTAEEATRQIRQSLHELEAPTPTLKPKEVEVLVPDRPVTPISLHIHDTVARTPAVDTQRLNQIAERHRRLQEALERDTQRRLDYAEQERIQEQNRQIDKLEQERARERESEVYSSDRRDWNRDSPEVMRPKMTTRFPLIFKLNIHPELNALDDELNKVTERNQVLTIIKRLQILRKQLESTPDPQLFTKVTRISNRATQLAESLEQTRDW